VNNFTHVVIITNHAYHTTIPVQEYLNKFSGIFWYLLNFHISVLPELLNKVDRLADRSMKFVHINNTKIALHTMALDTQHNNATSVKVINTQFTNCGAIDTNPLPKSDKSLDSFVRSYFT
jgi:hypothetical protein